MRPITRWEWRSCFHTDKDQLDVQVGLSPNTLLDNEALHDSGHTGSENFTGIPKTFTHETHNNETPLVQTWPKDEINVQMINNNANAISYKKVVKWLEICRDERKCMLFCVILAFLNSLTIKSSEKVTLTIFFLCQRICVICNNIFKWNLTNLSVHCYCLSALTSALELNTFSVRTLQLNK